MCKYTTDLPKRMEEWIAENGFQEMGGGTMKDLCSHFGFSDQSFYRWSEAHVEFVEAIKNGKERYKENLKTTAVNSLMALVKGGTSEEEVIEYTLDKNGNPRQSKKKVTRKRISPNVSAVIFTLANLDPENWKNRQNSETKIDAEGLSVIIGEKSGVKARTTEEE